MEFIFLSIPFLLIFAGIAYLVHSARKNKKTKTKEERRAESITAIIILVIIILLAFFRQSIKQNKIDDVIQESNITQSTR